jgi:hypothetical protein
MYTNIITCVRACDDESDVFSIKIRLQEDKEVDQDWHERKQ